MNIIASPSCQAVKQSKAWVCGCLPAEIAGPNPAESVDVCLLWVLCVVNQSSLHQADHSSRGVLLTVVCHCVRSRNLMNEGVIACIGPQHHKKKRLQFLPDMIKNYVTFSTS